jgi:hypothetical protein
MGSECHLLCRVPRVLLFCVCFYLVKSPFKDALEVFAICLFFTFFEFVLLLFTKEVKSFLLWQGEGVPAEGSGPAVRTGFKEAGVFVAEWLFAEFAEDGPAWYFQTY